MDKIPPGSNLEHTDLIMYPHIPYPSRQDTQALTANKSHLQGEGKPKDLSHPPRLSPDGYHFSLPRKAAVARDKLKQKSHGCEIQMRQKNAFTQPSELCLPNCAGYKDREQTG